MYAFQTHLININLVFSPKTSISRNFMFQVNLHLLVPYIEGMPYLCIVTTSNIIIDAFLWPVYKPCQAVGQFFHLQYIQSMIPSIPRKLRVAFYSQILVTSLGVECLSYSRPNIVTTALQKKLSTSSIMFRQGTNTHSIYLHMHRKRDNI